LRQGTRSKTGAMLLSISQINLTEKDDDYNPLRSETAQRLSCWVRLNNHIILLIFSAPTLSADTITNRSDRFKNSRSVFIQKF